MPKLMKDRPLATLSKQIVVHLHAMFGFLQTTHTSTIKEIFLKRSPTITDQNHNIRTVKRNMVEKSCVQYAGAKETSFLQLVCSNGENRA